MKTYRAERIIQTDAAIAWRALSEMNLWLPKLSTVRKIEYDKATTFFQNGRNYNVFTPEGIVMRSQISKIDTKNMSILIKAHFVMIKSQLICRVTSINNTSCKVIREQGYPGLVGNLFTCVYGKREFNETDEYLCAWEAHASSIRSLAVDLSTKQSYR